MVNTTAYLWIAEKTNHYMMKDSPFTELSFEDTSLAFEYKNNQELKKARWLFSVMGKRRLLKAGLLLTPLAIRWRLPFTRLLIRDTIFKQFVGGETMEETAPVVNKLSQFGVDVILDYGVEGGEGEEAFMASTQEFVRVIQYASTSSNIPFISIKVTGIARFALLEKLHSLIQQHVADTLMKKYTAAVALLSEEEQAEWQSVVERLHRISATAAEKQVGVLIDAEESWIQDPVDALTMLMMDSFNRSSCVIYNTIQLYRHDRYEFLRLSYQAAKERNFILGAKLVRGAYMEKERARSIQLGYASPIQSDKKSTDNDFDRAVAFCIENINGISLIVASHNEKSNMHTVKLMQAAKMEHHHPHVHFSQLYGMSDNITFNLARWGCNISKYLPFGPIKDVIPYLMRRAQENSSVSGQTGRELALIEKELRRRKEHV